MVVTSNIAAHLGVRSSGRDSGDRRTDDTSKDGSVSLATALPAFDVLLDTLRHSTAIALPNEEMSASQIFEPASEHPQVPTERSLEAGERPALRDANRQGSGRASVEARLSYKAENPSPNRADTFSAAVGKDPYGTKAGSTTDPLNPQPGDLGRSAGGPGRSGVDPTNRDGRTEIVAATSSEAHSRGKAQAFTTPSPMAAQVRVAASTGGRNAPFVQAVQGTQEARPNVAQQVGRLIGSQSGGESNSSSATAATPTSQAPAKSSTTAEQLGRTLTGESSPSTAKSGEANDVDSTRRTDFSELVRSMRINLGNTQSTARIRLNPPNLGRIHVEVRMSGDEVFVDVRTETADAQRLLSDKADNLRSALEEAGIHVQKFDVTTEGREAFSSGLGQPSQERTSQASGGPRNVGRPATNIDTQADAERDSTASELSREDHSTAAGRSRLDIRV